MSKLIRTSLPYFTRATKPKYTLYKSKALPSCLKTQAVFAVTPRRGFSTELDMKAKESTGMKNSIMKFLYENKQRPVPTLDKNVVLTNCPHCLQVRKNSFAAHLNLQKGTYQCKTCKSKGSFPEFSKSLLKKVSKPGHEGFSILSSSDIMHGGTKEVKFVRPIEEIEKYPQILADNTAALDKLVGQHGIEKDTLELYKVGTSTINETSCLTFPQISLAYNPDDKTGEETFKFDTVRINVCEMDNPSNLIETDPPTHSKGGSSGLFGYQTVSEESDTLIMTRRELDAMAAYQATGIPAVSIPTSNYQLQESVLPLLERFSRIYLWLDDDLDGQIAAERFATKIGDSKCLLVHTRLGNKEGPLNAYEALKENKDLKEIVNSARRIRHDKIVDFYDLREEVYNEILHPDQTRGVQLKDLPALNNITKGHRSGELTILTGPTGAGKTTIISQMSLDLCQSGVPTLWGSFEIMNKRLAKKMLFQYAGKDISLVPEEFDQIADEFQQLPLYFLKFFSSTAIGDVLKACHYAVYAYDVRHIVLDNLQFMLSQQGSSGLDKWELQDSAIAEIRNFATQQDVHITLVVHPRKDSGEELDINSIFGSAKVTQEADNVIIIQKPSGRSSHRSLDVKKNRFDGTLGTMPYIFDRDSNKIRELNEEELAKKKKSDFQYGSTTTTYKRSK